MRSTLSALLLLTLATSALAVDGVLEINQTCAVETGCFAGDAPGFPVTITQPGSYVLTSNLTLPDENTIGIFVDANDVGIDLNDFVIVRSGCENVIASHCTPASGNGSGVWQDAGDRRRTSVTNGGVIGMGGIGVRLAGDGSVVTDMHVRWNRIAGIDAATGSIISGNTAQFNGSYGIHASGASLVSANNVTSNNGTGIFAPQGSAVIANTLFSNAGTGIETGPGVTVSGNTVNSTGSDGIAVLDGSSVTENIVRSAGGYGLNLGPDATYRENTITDSTEGPVTGTGVNLGDNYCAGPNVVSSSCP